MYAVESESEVGKSRYNEPKIQRGAGMLQPTFIKKRHVFDITGKLTILS